MKKLLKLPFYLILGYFFIFGAAILALIDICIINKNYE